jgi:hypothetical protein
MFKLFSKKRLTLNKLLLSYISDEEKINYLIGQGIFLLTVNVYYTSFYSFNRIYENNQIQKVLKKVNISLGQYLDNNKDNLKKLLNILTDSAQKDNEYIEKDKEELKSTIESFIKTFEEI